MIMTPFVLKNISFLANLLDKEDLEDETLSEVKSTKLSNHVVIIGYGRLGWRISNLLRKQGIEFVAIEADIKTVKDARKKCLPVIFGNAAQKDILESVNIKEVTAVIISLGNSQKLYHVCQVVNDLTHNTKTIVKVDSLEDKEDLADLNLTHIIIETEKTAIAMFNEVMRV